MKRLRTYVITSLVLCLSGCGLFGSRTPSAPPGEPPPPRQTPASDSVPNPEQAENPAIPVPEDVQVYQDPDGMFALALPKGYSFAPGDQGLTFKSADNGFVGEISYQETENPSNDLLDLEQSLKDHIEPQFATIDWQKSGQRQPDGSVRLAWTGEDKDGHAIDALSFIEVHGVHTFILNLYAIDQNYNTYGDDARIIAGTYVVRKAEEVTPESDTGDESENGSPSDDGKSSSNNSASDNT